MDPLACLSVTGTVVQFIDFLFKVLSESRQLYESGELPVHAQTRRFVDDLSDYSALMDRSIRAEESTGPLMGNELELQKICRECAVIANDMTKKLSKFAVSGKGNVWKSVGQVLKSIWSKEDLGMLEERLSRYRDMMNTRLLGSLRERVIALHENQYGQTAVINNRTEELIANALLEIHASLNTERRHAKLLANVRHGATIESGGLCFTATQLDNTAIYKNIQQEEAELRGKIAEELTESLCFDNITERFDALAEAHKETLEWIFESLNTEDGVQWTDFVQWLREGDGIYWINGKAGSGKSTLMKYIIENKSTDEHLKHWAKNVPLYIGTFFFWWAGTKIQKAQEGLLRSLLYEILRKVPSLIPIVLPSKYAECYGAKTNVSQLRVVENWSLSALSKAFQALLSQTEVPIKICLFIDGLDEYDGLDADIAQVLRNVSHFPNIKACVSSRPHVPFEDAFATQPKLKLDALTRNDIKLYIADHLERNPMMQRLAKQDPQQCQNLFWEIAHAAQGVFIWVKIVVDSLIRGLSNHDNVATLQRRLRTYPRDLDTLYQQMVFRVDEVYAEEASCLFQLVETAMEHKLSLLGLHFAMKQDLDLSQALKDTSFNPKIVEEQGRSVDVMLKTRCGGLIETEYRGPNSPDFSPFMQVFYMHRTVRDFLVAPETRQILRAQTSGMGNGGFSPNIAIFKSIVLQMKGYSPRRCLEDPFGKQALLYAQRIDADRDIPIADVVSLFEPFLALIGLEELADIDVECGLRRYVQWRLDGTKLDGTKKHGSSCCVQ